MNVAIIGMIEYMFYVYDIFGYLELCSTLHIVYIVCTICLLFYIKHFGA